MLLLPFSSPLQLPPQGSSNQVRFEAHRCGAAGPWRCWQEGVVVHGELEKMKRGTGKLASQTW
uniref:Uncharacterized protein n=1 Tax=Setaria italica TaxID=4555 RepID=K3YXH8_SETIT